MRVAESTDDVSCVFSLEVLDDLGHQTQRSGRGTQSRHDRERGGEPRHDHTSYEWREAAGARAARAGGGAGHQLSSLSIERVVGAAHEWRLYAASFAVSR